MPDRPAHHRGDERLEVLERCAAPPDQQSGVLPVEVQDDWRLNLRRIWVGERVVEVDLYLDVHELEQRCDDCSRPLRFVIGYEDGIGFGIPDRAVVGLNMKGSGGLANRDPNPRGLRPYPEDTAPTGAKDDDVGVVAIDSEPLQAALHGLLDGPAGHLEGALLHRRLSSFRSLLAWDLPDAALG